MYKVKSLQKKNYQNSFEKRLIVQTRLKTGQPGDRYEREADVIAEKVMRMGDTDTMQMQPVEEKEEVMQPKLRMQLVEEEEEPIQMKCANCEKEDEMLQPKPDFRIDATPSIQNQIHSSAGGGNKLPDSTNQFMSTALGADFSEVKIHTSSSAIQMNKQLKSRAFNYGNNIYFNRGKYEPGSKVGNQLLAHELTHVVQQGKAGMRLQKSESKTDNTQCKSTSTNKGDAGPSATICFPTDSDKLDSSDTETLYYLLRYLFRALNQQPLKAYVYGFADSRGDFDYNLKLSERRAYAVANYIKTYMPPTGNSLDLQYHGNGVAGPSDKNLQGKDLNDYRVVEVFIDQTSKKPTEVVGCENITKWLDNGSFISDT